MKNYNNENIIDNISSLNNLNSFDFKKFELDISKSVCQIEFKVKFGSGFLIKLEKGDMTFYCLMTCEHIINKNILKHEGSVTAYYNHGKNFFTININKAKRFMKEYTFIDIDAIVIEILPEDNIEETFFIKNNINYLYDSENPNKNIYIISYPKENRKNFSKGQINSITQYNFTYTADNNYILSGSPIFALINNNISVIGIHKRSKKDNFNINYGTFIGSVIDSLKRNLKISTFDYNNGRYIGEYNGDIVEGYGKFVRNNNSYYIGQWLNDCEHGKGVIYSDIKSNNKNIIYDGNFENGFPEGEGKCYYENEDYYIGLFSKGIRHGKGIIYYKNGNIKFKGDFVEDKAEGNGTYIWEDGEYYEGQFYNNLKHGKGKEYYKNGNIKFEGDFVMGKFDGNGKYYYKNGDYYVGQWLNGLKHGKGIIYSKDNIILYDGFFVNGEKCLSEFHIN